MSSESRVRASSLALMVLLSCNPSITVFDYCHRADCAPNSKHGVCGGCTKAPNVQIIETTPAFRKAILDEHNKIREMVAAGKNTTSGLSSASNMRALSYDMSLEYTASCYIYKSGKAWYADCLTTEDFDQVGQNQLASDKFDPTTEAVAREAPDNWFGSILNLLTAAQIAKFQMDHKGRQVTRLTQMLWALTTHIGCAVCWIDRPNKKYLVACSYGPSGNINDEPVFVAGPPASACPPGSRKNAKIVALCGEIEPMPLAAYEIGHPDLTGRPMRMHNRTANAVRVLGEGMASSLAVALQLLL